MHAFLICFDILLRCAPAAKQKIRETQGRMGLSLTGYYFGGTILLEKMPELVWEKMGCRSPYNPNGHTTMRIIHVHMSNCTVSFYNYQRRGGDLIPTHFEKFPNQEANSTCLSTHARSRRLSMEKAEAEKGKQVEAAEEEKDISSWLAAIGAEDVRDLSSG